MMFNAFKKGLLCICRNKSSSEIIGLAKDLTIDLFVTITCVFVITGKL